MSSAASLVSDNGGRDRHGRSAADSMDSTGMGGGELPPPPITHTGVLVLQQWVGREAELARQLCIRDKQLYVAVNMCDLLHMKNEEFDAAERFLAGETYHTI